MFLYFCVDQNTSIQTISLCTRQLLLHVTCDLNMRSLCMSLCMSMWERGFNAYLKAIKSCWDACMQAISAYLIFLSFVVVLFYCINCAHAVKSI